MAYQDQLIPNEPRALPVVTVTSKTTVTSPAPAPATGYNTPEPQPSPSYRVGPAVVGSPNPTHQSLPPKSAYSAPPRQQHPPHSRPGSHGNDNGHHDHAYNGKAGGDEPVANVHHHHHYHHKATSQTGRDSTSSGPAALNTSPVLSPDAHRSKSGAGLHKTIQSQGMSSGAKAGLAIGLLLAFALVGFAIFLVYRRKKKQNASHQSLDNEKTDLHNSQRSISSHVSVRRTVANAPRLSLRPVTEMFPAMCEKSDNAAVNSLNVKSGASPRAKTPETTRSAQANADGATNPFGDDAEATINDDQNALTAPAAVVPKPLSVKSERTGSGSSDRLPLPNSQAPVTPGAASAAPRPGHPGPGPNNVHRVQLDFNPSMDDELGLRAGQLVRMLHEYDDGWALCIRLDRSQQGVVPRTCISKLPVKPRPQGPQGNMRGPPPQGRPRGPSNAPGPRMQANDARHRPMVPPNGRMRSQSNTPHQARPQSPGPLGGQSIASQTRPRANSDAMSARRITPPSGSPPSSAGTSPTQGMNNPVRKPVPGQAL